MSIFSEKNVVPPSNPDSILLEYVSKVIRARKIENFVNFESKEISSPFCTWSYRIARTRGLTGPGISPGPDLSIFLFFK